MPFINSKVTCKLDSAKKATLIESLGEIIQTIPGKSPSRLMIGFKDNYPLYFAGDKLENGAFVEIKIFGKTTASILKEVTKQICDLYHKELDISPTNLYVTYEFIEHKG